MRWTHIQSTYLDFWSYWQFCLRYDMNLWYLFFIFGRNTTKSFPQNDQSWKYILSSWKLNGTLTVFHHAGWKCIFNFCGLKFLLTCIETSTKVYNLWFWWIINHIIIQQGPAITWIMKANWTKCLNLSLY